MTPILSRILARLGAGGQNTGRQRQVVTDPAAKSEDSAPAEQKTVLYDSDEFYHDLYEKGLVLSGTPDRGPKRRMRFFNLMQALEATAHLSGWVAECGCWKGLSSYLSCHYILRHNQGFRGDRFLVIDSFEGLSAPTREDTIDLNLVVKGVVRRGRPFKSAGAYSAPMDHVARVLEQFPEVSLVKGWIPEVLDTLPEREYRFVHVDLDLYAPILGALRYFYPRIQRGGVIVCDDYGSLFWPGAAKAVRDFCDESGATLLANVSGQALLFRF